MLYRGLLATQLSGAIDGLIASHNSGGAYFRNRTTPTNPNTSRQIYMRGALNAAYANWLDLSPELRGQWEAYARSVERTNRIGSKRHNSGWNEFVRAFTYRLYAESQLSIGYTTILSTITLPQPTIGPVGTQPYMHVGDPTLYFSYDDSNPWLTGTFGEGALLIELSGVRTSPGVVELTPYPPTRNFFKGPWQLAGVGNGAHPNPVTINLSRAPVLNERVFWRARITTLLNGLGPVTYGVAVCIP